MIGWGPAAQNALAAAQELGAFTGDEWTVLVVEHAMTGDTWPSPWSVQAPDATTAQVMVAALHGGDADIIGVLPGSHALAYWPPRVQALEDLRQDHPELAAAVRAVHAARIADTRHASTNPTEPDPLGLDEDQPATTGRNTATNGAHR